MYKILTIQDKIRVEPTKFELGLEEAVKKSLEDRWEGIITRNGVNLAVVSVADIGEGTIIAGDSAIHYPVKYDILVYIPEMHEIVKGHIIDVTEFGVFVRMGPLDGMVHVSQIMDDFVSYDIKKNVFSGRDSKRALKEGDVVTARIISISIGAEQYKIGLTMRQPGLGADGWEKLKKKTPEKKPAHRERGPAPKGRGRK